MKTDHGLDLKSAIDWILESGIQGRNGGFYAWYDCEKEKYPFYYPEATGYAVSLLSQLYEITKEPIFVEKASTAGDWLGKIWNENDTMFCRFFDETETWDRSQYTFDVGICTSGLLDLYNVTSDEEYLDVSLEMADWLLMLQDSDGSFFAGRDHEGKILDAPHWSTTKGCHHLKIALTLLELYKITQNRRYLDSVKKLLKWGMGLWLKPGRFATFQGSTETYAHANCYATESLLFSSKLLDNVANPSLTEHAVDVARWLSRIQNSDGSIWNWHNCQKEKMKVCDALSQALRIWTISRTFVDENEAMKFSASIEKGLGFLGRMQCLNVDKRSNGGVYYAERNGEIIRHVNSWVTFFAANASLLLKKEKDADLADSLF